MTRFALELGGKSPVIILDDADVQSAAQGAAQAIFINSGQVCVAGSRLYIHKSRFDAVVAEIGAIARGMKIGSASTGHADRAAGFGQTAETGAGLYRFWPKRRRQGACRRCEAGHWILCRTHDFGRYEPPR